MTFYETSRIPSISSPSDFPQDGEDTMHLGILGGAKLATETSSNRQEWDAEEPPVAFSWSYYN